MLDVQLRRPGRPPLSREAALEQIKHLPSRGRGLRLVNARKLGAALGCHRATVGVMLNDLERSNRLTRRELRGKRGLLIELAPVPAGLNPVAIPDPASRTV